MAVVMLNVGDAYSSILLLIKLELKLCGLLGLVRNARIHRGPRYPSKDSRTPYCFQRAAAYK